jgi:hypothetical protein
MRERDPVAMAKEVADTPPEVAEPRQGATLPALSTGRVGEPPLHAGCLIEDNTAQDIANRLVWAYPGHSFVIDREEVDDIGLKRIEPNES